MPKYACQIGPGTSHHFSNVHSMPDWLACCHGALELRGPPWNEMTAYLTPHSSTATAGQLQHSRPTCPVEEHDHRSASVRPSPRAATETRVLCAAYDAQVITNRIQLVLSGMQSRTMRPYLAPTIDAQVIIETINTSHASLLACGHVRRGYTATEFPQGTIYYRKSTSPSFYGVKLCMRFSGQLIDCEVVENWRSWLCPAEGNMPFCRPTVRLGKLTRDQLVKHD
jgi:hypothetical protein